MKIPISKPSLKGLEESVDTLLALAESKGRGKLPNGMDFQAGMDCLDLIKWSIICEAVNLVKSDAFRRLKEDLERNEEQEEA